MENTDKNDFNATIGNTGLSAVVTHNNNNKKNNKNMEFNGTKGEWIYENSLQMFSGYRQIFSEQGILIHKSENKKGLGEIEIEANALLISKAPEMLEMLKRISYNLKNEECPFDDFEIDNLIKEATEL